MSTYRVKFPYIPSMGSVGSMVCSGSALETPRQNALCYLSSMTGNPRYATSPKARR